MYHSITFGDKNTWDDWHLIPSSAPVFSPPEVQTNFIDIPGLSGSIDLTESLTGYPLFKSREGSFEFYVIPDYATWVETYNMVSRHLHGQYMDAILEDDRGFYYRGRFSVNDYKSEKDWDKIVIDYHVDPYKWEHNPWLWDPFSFEHGVIRHGVYVDPVTGIEYKGAGVLDNIPIPSDGYEIDFTIDEAGVAPATVTFTAGSACDIYLAVDGVSDPFKITSGTSSTIPGLVLYRGVWRYETHPTTITATPDPLYSGDAADLTIDFVMGDF